MKKSRILTLIGLGCLLVASLFIWSCAQPAAPAGTPTKAPAGAVTPVASPSATNPAGGTTSPAKAGTPVPSPYTGTKNPFTPQDSAAVTAGQGIYQQRCLACHGEKGDGKGPAGSSLNPPPANFTASPFKEKFTAAQDELFWRVSEGIPGTAMPAFKGQLSEEQRWQVITHEWRLSTGG